MTDRWPRVPETRLDAGAWQLADRTRERLFELPRVTVEGHTLMYEEPSVGERLDTDEPLCFFFATRLGFEPNLSSGATTVRPRGGAGRATRGPARSRARRHERGT